MKYLEEFFALLFVLAIIMVCLFGHSCFAADYFILAKSDVISSSASRLTPKVAKLVLEKKAFLIRSFHIVDINGMKTAKAVPGKKIEEALALLKVSGIVSKKEIVGGDIREVSSTEIEDLYSAYLPFYSVSIPREGKTPIVRDLKGESFWEGFKMKKVGELYAE